jgi:hypothetical protein
VEPDIIFDHHGPGLYRITVGFSDRSRKVNALIRAMAAKGAFMKVSYGEWGYTNALPAHRIERFAAWVASKGFVAAYRQPHLKKD